MFGGNQNAGVMKYNPKISHYLDRTLKAQHESFKQKEKYFFILGLEKKSKAGTENNYKPLLKKNHCMLITLMLAGGFGKISAQQQMPT